MAPEKLLLVFPYSIIGIFIPKFILACSVEAGAQVMDDVIKHNGMGNDQTDSDISVLCGSNSDSLVDKDVK